MGVDGEVEIQSALAVERLSRYGGQWVFPGIGALFALLALFVAQDVLADFDAGIEGLHLVLEGVSLGLALLGAGLAVRYYQRAVHRAERLQGDLRRTREDLERWRGGADGLLRRLGPALDRQFDRWGLTDPERVMAILLLQGRSCAEIAEVRGTAERTVRQQARAVYRKAGLSGRAEMAAFFLEALLFPLQRAADGDGPRAAPPARSDASA